MKKVIKTTAEVYKNLGETPLQALERFRKEEKIDPKTPMTYAGRLDPAAEGVLLILIGDECKNKERYLARDKEYEIEVLFGLETDTGDVLGLIKRINIENIQRTATRKEASVDFQKYVGKFVQEYPVYSSKMIAAKEVGDEMPTKNVEIYSIKKHAEKEIYGHEVALKALEVISKVDGDFRQQDIGEEWYAFGQEFGNFPFKAVTLSVACSSGTYMRSLAERIGKDAGVGAFAYSIKRNSISNS
jgi:tRNA pseudouridine(55) synthase